MNKVCVFSTSNDSYAPYAITSLLCVRERNPSLDLYIIGSSFNDINKKLMEKFDIKYCETDLKRVFSRTWQYPIECYYVFSGPEILIKMGYQYSIYIDGDVYCNRDPLRGFDIRSLKFMAGYKLTECHKMLKKDLKSINTEWSVKNTVPEDTKSIQSGVIFFNNKALEKISFSRQIGELFARSIKINSPRKGDDSLLSLYTYLNYNQNFLDLGALYDFIPSYELQHKGLFKIMFLQNKIVFCHFTLDTPKPWNLSQNIKRDRLTRAFSSGWIKKYKEVIKYV